MCRPERQAGLVAEHPAKQDIVATTAPIPGNAGRPIVRGAEM